MPEPLPSSPSSALIDGVRLLGRRPAWTLGLIAMGTLLGQSGPALELLAKADANPVLRLALTLLINLPFVFFCIPAWLSRLDADLKDHPANPEAGWSAGFERRWPKAVWPAIFISFSAWIGCALVIPGAAILAFTGFTPTRMLLRDESFGSALQWNLRSMARFWQKLVPSALGILIVLAVCVLGLLMILSVAMEGQGQTVPSARFLLTHPLIWAAQALQALMLLWLSGTWLRMYHRLEALSGPPFPDQPR